MVWDGRPIRRVPNDSGPLEEKVTADNTRHDPLNDDRVKVGSLYSGISDLFSMFSERLCAQEARTPRTHYCTRDMALGLHSHTHQRGSDSLGLGNG